MGVLRTKSIEQSIADTDEPEYQLKKNLTALDLTVFGVGVIIGAGIFTLTGRAAATVAGPAIVLSFVVSAICCGLAALCYAEFASTVPVSGSAYTFSYASLGEMIAWIIGWDLLLELLLGRQRGGPGLEHLRRGADGQLRHHLAGGPRPGRLGRPAGHAADRWC